MVTFHLMDQNPEKRVYRERHRKGDRDSEMGRRKPVNHETQRKGIKKEDSQRLIPDPS